MAQAASSAGGDRWHILISRLVWGSLMALHLAPMARLLPDAMASGENLGSVAALLVVQTLFVLKVLDVGWLRWRSRRTTIIALLLLGLAGHGDVAAQGAEQMPMAAPVAGAVAIGAGTTVFLRRRRWLPNWSLTNWSLKWSSNSSLTTSLHGLRLSFNRIASDLLAHPCRRMGSIAAVPCMAGRGPPL